MASLSRGTSLRVSRTQKYIFHHKGTENTEEYSFTMKDMKVMKIIHESVNVCGYTAFIH